MHAGNPVFVKVNDYWMLGRKDGANIQLDIDNFVSVREALAWCVKHRVRAKFEILGQWYSVEQIEKIILINAKKELPMAPLKHRNGKPVRPSRDRRGLAPLIGAGIVRKQGRGAKVHYVIYEHGIPVVAEIMKEKKAVAHDSEQC
jgi:hypothetical protein